MSRQLSPISYERRGSKPEACLQPEALSLSRPLMADPLTVSLANGLRGGDGPCRQK